jgi:site-specific DNA-methyltransferase (adenine-specific)
VSPTPYYSDDAVTIYHGDCRDVLPQLSVELQAVVTDPPYGLGGLLKGGGPKWPLHDDGDGRNSNGLPWDQFAPGDVVEMLPNLATTCIVWGGNYFALPPRRGWLVWDKIVRQFSTGHCELAWTTLDQPVRAFNYAHGQLASEGKFHPTQKPLPLMAWCLSFLPPATGAVLDPFMGSGTTLRAAKDRNLPAIGIEAEERYCEIAAKRLAQEVLDLSP